METRPLGYLSRTERIFGDTFPSEGNGNTSHFGRDCFCQVFGDTFPLEGNGNTTDLGPSCNLMRLWRHFPVGREWKLVDMPLLNFRSEHRLLETLSRWNGMETD